jgi:predicted dehydrogenase
MEQIRWGIIGAGRIAHTFVRDARLTDHGVVQAVAARDGAAARAFAEQHDIPDAHTGYDALYGSDRIDAVYVATPHSLHLQHASDALRAGKAVLCEKPLTTSAEECRQLMDVASSSGSYLMEAMWTWFLPAIRRAKEWVDAGRIGELRHIKADFGYPLPYSPDSRAYNAELAGGCLLDMGVYPVALVALFVSRDPDSINVVARYAPNGVEDDVVALLDYPGLVASIATSFRCKLPNSACIVGDEGYIVIPDFFRARECQLWVLDDLVERFEVDRKGNGFEYQFDAVNRDLIAGRRQSDIVPLSESLRFQVYMDRIRAGFTSA